jgi:hypothetical protein
MVMTVSIIATERIRYAPGKSLNYDTYRVTCDLCGETFEMGHDDFMDWAINGDGVFWQRMPPNWDACPKHEVLA